VTVRPVPCDAVLIVGGSDGSLSGAVELTENTDVDSGDIVIQAVTGRSRARLVWDWYAKFFKLRSREAHTQDFRGKSLRLDTRPQHHISVDGELLARTQVKVRVAESAIEVVVPI
jgi:diacylglycerol kinase family enzyme